MSRGIIAFYSRDLETAIRDIETVTRLHPRFALGHYFLGQCYERTEDRTRSVESLRRAVHLADESSETLAALGHALAQVGRGSEAETILRRLQERSGKRYVSPALLAQVLTGLGRTEGALGLLEEAIQKRATDLIWVDVRPVYDPLKASPRFQAITDDLGLQPDL